MRRSLPRPPSAGPMGRIRSLVCPVPANQQVPGTSQRPRTSRVRVQAMRPDCRPRALGGRTPSTPTHTGPRGQQLMADPLAGAWRRGRSQAGRGTTALRASGALGRARAPCGASATSCTRAGGAASGLQGPRRSSKAHEPLASWVCCQRGARPSGLWVTGGAGFCVQHGSGLSRVRPSISACPLWTGHLCPALRAHHPCPRRARPAFESSGPVPRGSWSFELACDVFSSWNLLVA